MFEEVEITGKGNCDRLKKLSAYSGKQLTTLNERAGFNSKRV